MTITIADILTIVAIFAVPVAGGIYMGRECYYGRMGRVMPAFFVGIACASGLAQAIGAGLKLILKAIA